MNVNHSITRTIRNVPIRLGHEALRDEILEDPTIMQTIRAPRAERKECILDLPAYAQHPLVEKARESGGVPPVPVGIYVD
eukprot:369156-Pyramimonas_sp.AAC.1